MIKAITRKIKEIRLPLINFVLILVSASVLSFSVFSVVTFSLSVKGSTNFVPQFEQKTLLQGIDTPHFSHILYFFFIVSLEVLRRSYFPAIVFPSCLYSFLNIAFRIFFIIAISATICKRDGDCIGEICSSET